MRVSVLVGSVLLCIGLCADVSGQSWRELVPLHSTCEDAKKAFKLSKCDPATVELDDVRLFITFSDGTCRTEWNVPVGTVLSVDVWPKKALRFEDLKIDPAKYLRAVDQRTPDVVVFTDPLAGIGITTFEDGRIRHFFYGPSTKDDYLRCNARETPVGSGEPGYVKIDEYGFISSDAEVARLDQLADTLKGWLGARAFIIVYPGPTTTVEQAKERASRSQTYLVNTRGVDTARVVTLIGGDRGEPVIQLFIVVKNGTPPEPVPKRKP